MADDTRITLTKNLIAHLQEQTNNGLPLHTQADELAQSGQLRPALHLCWSSMEIAGRQNEDDYIFGAARFHMALAYFCAGTQEEWDRAAELCEQAAHHFESKRALREQGIALLARAYILEALCDLNQDRWQQALRACAEGYTLLRQVTRHLGEEALQIYGALGRKYVEKGLADEAVTKSADGNASGPKDTTATGNSTAPKADTFAQDPKAEPAPAAAPFPNGITSKRAIMEKSFDSWRLSAIMCVSAAIVILLFIAGRGILAFINDEPMLGMLISIGAGLSLGLSALTFSILFFTNQLVLRLAPAQVAVIIEKGRVWTIEGPGVHWLFPFRQDVVAIISQTPKTYQKFVPDVSLLQNRVLNANICAEYLVIAADQFWNRVLSHVPRSHVWGIPRPLSGQAIEAALDTEAHALLQSAVIEITNDPTKRRVTAREDRFNAEICKFLQGEALKDGIAFQQVSFRIMTSYAEGKA